MLIASIIFVSKLGAVRENTVVLAFITKVTRKLVSMLHNTKHFTRENTVKFTLAFSAAEDWKAHVVIDMLQVTVCQKISCFVMS